MCNFTACLVVLALACGSIVGSTPAAAADHPGWTQALEGKGDYGYFKKWFYEDGCYKQSFVQCKDFKAALRPTKWPAELIADALKLNLDRATTSTACVSAWGCDTAVASMELVALRGDAADKEMLLGVLGDEKVYTGPAGRHNRALLVRILAWYGDKTSADLVKKYVAFEPGKEFSNYALSAGAALFETWNNNGLIEECKAMFEPDLKGYGVDEARTSCAHYLARFGDKSIVTKLARIKVGDDGVNDVMRAAMGDASSKAEWQGKVKEMAKNPDNSARISALLGLAILGDAKAEKEFLGNVFGADGNLSWEHSKYLVTVAGLPIAKKVVDAAKKGLAKLPVKEIGGRAKANVVAFLLKEGDASALPVAKTLFAAADAEVRRQLAANLSGKASNSPMSLKSNGAGAAAPIAGLAAVLDEAWSNETETGIRYSIADSWAMVRSAGGN